MKIHRERLEEIIEHAWRDSPRECCGLLVGPVEGAEEVERVVPCENSLQSPRAFSIPPRQLFELFRQIRTEGRSLVGIYHSHPTTEAVPSDRDVKEFFYPGVSYWIISLQGKAPVVRCFRWKESRFEELPFQVIGDSDATV